MDSLRFEIVINICVAGAGGRELRCPVTTADGQRQRGVPQEGHEQSAVLRSSRSRQLSV